jgi:hypothetical protein
MKYNEIILILLFLACTLQSSFAQINTTTTKSIDKLDNTIAGGIIIEDSIVGEKSEQVQNQSNATGNTIEDSTKN